MSIFREIDLSKLKTYRLASRPSKVDLRQQARPISPGATIPQFLSALPDILAAKDFKAVVEAVVRARKKKRPVALAMGAHPIKVGLNPILIDLMERGVATSLAMNGAGIIHDFELALVGKTSEDVAAELDDGSFGMAEETANMLNSAVSEGVKTGWGLGEAVGRMIASSPFPYKKFSLLAAAHRLKIPATVHVAIGTDIIHMHPSADGAAIGEATMIDFKRFAAIVSELEGGVYFNIGSAVILPEVFLKALSVARNVGRSSGVDSSRRQSLTAPAGRPVRNFTVVNMDFLPHYRPLTNVVRRPTQSAGIGYSIIGHHEIMIPLLAAAVLSRMEGVR